MITRAAFPPEHDIHLPAGLEVINIIEAVAMLGAPVGIIIHGSRVSGKSDLLSDIDVVVLLASGQVNATHRMLGGVGLDIMAGREEEFRYCLDKQPFSKKCEVLINAAVTGHLIFDPTGDAARFTDDIKLIWQKGPRPLSVEEKERIQVKTAKLIRSAERLMLRGATEPSQALAGSIRCDQLVIETIYAYYRKTQQWTADFPKLIRRLQLDKHELGMWCHEYAISSSSVEKLDIARTMHSKVFRGW